MVSGKKIASGTERPAPAEVPIVNSHRTRFLMASNTSPNESPAVGQTAGANAAHGGNADLEAQVAKLREDVAGVADALKSLASNRADDAKRQAFALRDDVRERGEQYLRQAQDAASDLEEQLSEKVRAEPIKSVLIAVAAGYLYARLFRR